MNRKNYGPKTWIKSLFIVVLVLIIASPISLNDQIYSNIPLEKKVNSLNNQVINPVVVNGNANFTTSGIFTGNGLINDPYRLENVTIQANGNSGISISNTNAYFVLKNIIITGSSNSGQAAFGFSSIMFGQMINCSALNSYYGISLLNSNNNSFSNIIATNNIIGFNQDTSHNNTISSSKFDSNSDGFYVQKSSDNTYYNNTASFNTAYGFDFYTNNMMNNVIANNTMDSNNYGIRIGQSASFNLVVNNTVSNSIFYGIQLINSAHNNTIQLNTGYNNFEDIDGYYDYNNTIIDNVFYQGQNPSIQLQNSSQNLYINNTVNDNMYWSFAIHQSSHNTFINNTGIRNGFMMFFLSSSDYNDFTGNQAIKVGLPNYYDSTTFHLEAGSDFNTFNNNTAETYGYYGVSISASNNNTFNSNKISNMVRYGFYLDTSNNNTIIHNIVQNATLEGMYLNNANTTLITNNLIQDTGTYAVNISSLSTGNTITMNDFIRSSFSTLSLGRNDGLNNLFDNNYWGNCYLIQNNYPLDGQAGSIDANSAIGPNNMVSYKHLKPCILSDQQSVAYTDGSAVPMSLNWTLNGFNGSTYEVILNGTTITSGTWTNGTTVSQDVTGLSYGDWNYTIKVTNVYGQSLAKTMYVNVTDGLAPLIIQGFPSTFTMITGTTGNVLQINATDLHADHYELEHDGIVVEQGPWISGQMINISLDNLTFTGDYNYTIVLYDKGGNVAVSNCIVTVKQPTYPPPPPNNPKTTTTTTSSSKLTSTTSTITTPGWQITYVLLSLALVPTIYRRKRR